MGVTPPPNIVRLPAYYEALYVRVIADLDIHLTSDDGAAARQIVRPLVEKIVVQPGSARGGKNRRIQLHDDLYRMLEFAVTACARNAQKPGPRDRSFCDIVGCGDRI